MKVENKQVLKKYKVSMDTSEDFLSVVILSEVIDDSTPLGRISWSGSFYLQRLMWLKFHVIINKLWK